MFVGRLVNATEQHRNIFELHPWCAFQWPEWRIPPDRLRAAEIELELDFARGLPPDFSSEAGVMLVDGADLGAVDWQRLKF